MGRFCLVLLLVAGLGCAAPASVPSPEPMPEYLAEIREWQAGRLERLRSPDGWVALSGLYWLEEGDNPFGSDESLPIVFARDDVPAKAGTLVFDGTQVRLDLSPGTRVTIEGEPVESGRVLKNDNEPSTDVLELGSFRYYVIKRDDRIGLRVRDLENPKLTTIDDTEFFPVDPRFKVEGTFKPYDTPRTITVANVLGMKEEAEVFGVVEFDLDGRKYSLIPSIDDPAKETYWFLIRDSTSGKQTYGAGRYVYATNTDGQVTIDFNRSYNPPCAVTEFATCPLPPRDNWLSVAITAGEKYSAVH